MSGIQLKIYGEFMLQRIIKKWFWRCRQQNIKLAQYCKQLLKLEYVYPSNYSSHNSSLTWKPHASEMSLCPLQEYADCI